MERGTVEAGDIAAYGALPVPKLTPGLLSLVRTGQVYSLAVIVKHGIPVPGPLAPFSLKPGPRHGDLTDLAPASAAAETISMSAHTGTHIDALCHIGECRDDAGTPTAGARVHLHSYDGNPIYADEMCSDRGQHHMSIEHMPPIITRGILIDVAGYKGVDVLPDAYVITTGDVQGALAAQKTSIRPGTAVLTRTGFHRHLINGNDAYKDRIAGLGLDAARFLHQSGMILAGADNFSVEASPPLDHSVHRYLLVHNGVTHLENLYLEELAAKQIYEFLLIVTPLRIQGATGSWVHPIAIA